MQVITIKWWIVKLLKSLCFCTSSPEINQWNVYCFTPLFWSWDVLNTKQRMRASLKSLRWRHNENDSVSNHQARDCFLNRLLRHRSKKTSKLRVTGLCVWNLHWTGKFPAQMASNAENVSFDDVIMCCGMFHVCSSIEPYSSMVQAKGMHRRSMMTQLKVMFGCLASILNKSTDFQWLNCYVWIPIFYIKLKTGHWQKAREITKGYNFVSFPIEAPTFDRRKIDIFHNVCNDDQYFVLVAYMTNITKFGKRTFIRDTCNWQALALHGARINEYSSPNDAFFEMQWQYKI